MGTKVTIQDVYVEQQKQKLQIDRLVSDAESEKLVRRDRNKGIDEENESICDRLDKLEKWQSEFKGAWMVFIIIGVLLSIAATIIALVK